MADQSTIERLDRMQREINEWKSSVARRKATSTILTVVFVLFMAGYLTFAYSRVATVQANEVVLMMEERLDKYINFSEPELTVEIAKLAPGITETAAQSVLQLPGLMEQKAHSHIKSELDTGLPELEKALEENFHKALLDAREKAIAQGKKVDDPAVTKEIVNDMTDVVTAEMGKTLDTFCADYTKQSADMINYIDMLAQNEKLDARAAMHRELLIHFFALVQKYEIEGTPDLIKGVKSQI